MSLINQKQTQKPSNDQLYQTYLRASYIRGPKYYKYQDFEIKINEQGKDNYQIIQKIGRGKYSDVFKCINTQDDQFYVLKILKPIKLEKIKREIKILHHLNHPGIVKLYDKLKDNVSGCICLVFQYVKVTDFNDLAQIIKYEEVQHYMYQLFTALKYCHSQGIMHRDIKPQNLLLDHKKKIVKIADWGLAEYYLPQEDYHVRVASRHYKGPQLLLNNKNYDYSLDIWSLGLVFTSMIFKKHTIFRGDDNPDQLNEIMKHFGRIQIENYIKKYKLQPDQPTLNHIKNCDIKHKRSWNHYVDKNNSQLCDTPALDLLDKMMQIDHKKRINVLDALQHPYFSSYRRNYAQKF